MSNKTKKSIIGVILAASIAGVVLTGGGVEKLDIGGKPRWLTKRQYNDLKNGLVKEYLLTGEFTIDEYQLFIVIMNKEAKKGKFQDLERVNRQNLLLKIIEKMEVKEIEKIEEEVAEEIEEIK